MRYKELLEGKIYKIDQYTSKYRQGNLVVTVYENPTNEQLKIIDKDPESKAYRGLLLDNGNILLWEGIYAVHRDIIDWLDMQRRGKIEHQLYGLIKFELLLQGNELMISSDPREDDELLRNRQFKRMIRGYDIF